ncbi:restriction of telomere capping protein 5 [Tothia fuscella]|uniref:Restriction of telomere capping protein 5 n=1 Tax=Tothia fuscella TaxID=1048955 RepID=A0A9P4P4A8_9PEZI|nr:restriction of telomere capping protein 5 [Tothia fuscella]
MGQGQSGPGPPQSIEHLSARLTQTFATKCYTPLELYCFKEVFRTLADHESDLKYWSESTLCRFLELPDDLNVGPIIFQLVSYAGAFPFPSQAPAILTNDALLRGITVLTGRWGKVLRGGKGGGDGGRRAWRREIWRGCSVFDRGEGPHGVKDKSNIVTGKEQERKTSAQGFAIDKPGESEEDEEDEDDGLVYSAFELMDAADAFKVADQTNILHAMIPSDNFLRLLQLLLLAAPLTPQESLGVYGVMLDEKRLSRLRETANCMLASFGVEKNPGISYKTFEKVMSTTMPHVLDGLQPLFEHFLFPKDFDLAKRKQSSSSLPPVHVPPTPTKELPPLEPLLPSEGDILDYAVLNQLSSFLSGNTLFRRLQPLYSGNNGFSMGQFEKTVFNWRAPSILLVSGTILSSHTKDRRERDFLDTLPYKRFHSSTSKGEDDGEGTRVTYGAYVPTPWKQTPKSCFGDSKTILFQLSPTHDVFPASTLDTSYIYFNRPPSGHTGLGFGSPLPSPTLSRRHPTNTPTSLPLSPLSLHIDDGLEFGVFTHDSNGGGSFLPSSLPMRGGVDWQDRFQIDALEVWGCGGSEEAEEQRKRWAWEEREAEARRRINFGTGDLEADRELLRMAGLIGQGRSGGSMG